MNKPIKAILLSALVLPGAGQLYLKRYWTGTLLIALTCAALYLLFRDIVSTANQVVEQALAGKIGMDSSSILRAVETQRAAAGNTAEVAWILMIGCWVVAIIDCIRIAIRSRMKGSKSVQNGN